MLLVTFDTVDSRREEALRALLDGFDAMRFAPNCYAIETALPARELFARLRPLFGDDDKVYLFTIREPWIGCGYEAMNDWLHRHLHP